MTGGACGVVDSDGAPVSCVGMVVGWTGAGLDVAGFRVAGLEPAGGAGIFDGELDRKSVV